MQKDKHHILYIVVSILFSLVCINKDNGASVSTLSYQSEVGIGFTFNPTLSISLSSGDLVISNLVPGSTADSNAINVSVATNAAYGYTLSATTNNNNLIYANNTNMFSSISTNADLASLDNSSDDNIWGYSYKDNSVVSPSWSNYNGLSSSNSATLLNTNTNNTLNNGVDDIDFKIAAKASSVQPSGIYTGTITFTAVTKPTPITLAEAYASEGKTMINGYYTMQDMTSTICERTEAIGSQLQVLDIRDYKVYWISKLADNHCWMTQNLDLDLDSNRTYTHWDTDLGWSTEDDNVIDESATWQPMRSTINFDVANTTYVSGWIYSDTEPSSANPGNIYIYTSNSEENDMQYNSLQECVNAKRNDCSHYHIGNYYSWSAAVAGNDTNNVISGNAPSSICPSGWKMPQSLYDLLNSYKITSNYTNNGFNNIRLSPLYFSRFGYIRFNSEKKNIGYEGRYWYSRCSNLNYSLTLIFDPSRILSNDRNLRAEGYSLRCTAR